MKTVNNVNVGQIVQVIFGNSCQSCSSESGKWAKQKQIVGEFIQKVGNVVTINKNGVLFEIKNPKSVVLLDESKNVIAKLFILFDEAMQTIIMIKNKNFTGVIANAPDIVTASKSFWQSFKSLFNKLKFWKKK